jgi:hypothetical protein
MGIRQFYLYGVDHSFKFQKRPEGVDIYKSAQGEGNHFIANYRDGKPWCPPATALIEWAFQVADRTLRKEGGWVKNATRGGHLDVLERIPFEAALDLSQCRTPARSV